MVDPAYAPGIRLLRVPDGSGGRVDRYVADATGLSRSYVQKLISDGRLTAAGEPLRSNAIVAAGTELRLDVPEPAALDLEPAPGHPADDRLRGRRPADHRQAGRAGRPSGARPLRRHAGQRAARPRRRVDLGRDRRRPATRASSTASTATRAGC